MWIHILMNANHKPTEEILGGKTIECNPGQFTTGRKQLANNTGISESKIERLLTKFEKIEQQIEQRKTTTNRLITVLYWSDYQETEQQTEQRPNNDRTTTEQRPNTLKEVKKLRSKEVIRIGEKNLSQRKEEFKVSLEEFATTYPHEMIEKFYDYWSEANKSQTKMRLELEKTWETNLRISTWSKRNFNNGFTSSQKKQGLPGQILQPDEARSAELLAKFEQKTATV
ncbi:MAG: hypothetical protein NTZ69_15860 [Bacteroidia bacterium]|nr:hypothetical protein [Bacteroidia bacterium]